MNFIIQRTKQTWLFQLISYFLFPSVDMWQTAMKSKNPIDFVIWFWITSLIILFLVGWTLVVGSLIMNPSLAENATFGIFDTLG